jgi:hypothetical protein
MRRVGRMVGMRRVIAVLPMVARIPREISHLLFTSFLPRWACEKSAGSRGRTSSWISK